MRAEVKPLYFSRSRTPTPRRQALYASLGTPMTTAATSRIDPKFVSLVWIGPERASELAEMHGQIFNPPWTEQSFVDLLSHPGSTAFLARVRERVDALPEPAETSNRSEHRCGGRGGDSEHRRGAALAARVWLSATILIEGLARAVKRAEAKRLFLEVAADNQAVVRL